MDVWRVLAAAPRLQPLRKYKPEDAESSRIRGLNSVAIAIAIAEILRVLAAERRCAGLSSSCAAAWRKHGASAASAAFPALRPGAFLKLRSSLGKAFSPRSGGRVSCP